MAVPQRRNGFNEDEEWESEEDGMEDDEGWIDLAEPEVQVAQELRAAMDAAEVGDVDALRLALGTIQFLTLSGFEPWSHLFSTALTSFSSRFSHLT